MSRSRRKTWKHGSTSAVSEKDDKRLANRRFRRMVREQIKNDEPLELLLVSLKEVSDIWDWAKDGKSFFVDPKLARK